MNATIQRGGRLWVAGQSVLSLVVLVAAPLRRGDLPLVWTGLPAAFLFLFAAWAGIYGVIALGRNLTPMPGPKAGAKLVTRGVYARIRHPLYASVMAMAVSWALAWGSLAGLGAAVLLAGFLHLKALHEEGLLQATFPEYAAYARSVPRYIPGVRRAGA